MQELIELCRPEVDGVLPAKAVYRILLNRSYDANADLTQEWLYPDDSLNGRDVALRECSEEEAVDVLWRQGRIPEWIDAKIVGETGEATLIELTCCGRFTANEDLLYHQSGGHPPFSLKGADHLNSSVSCFSLREFDPLPRIAKQVRFLTLAGDAFDDEVLTRLPRFPYLYGLELRATRVTGSCLVDLDKNQDLDTLTISAHATVAFDFDCLPRLPKVERLHLTHLSAGGWSHDKLWSKLPRLQRFVLTGQADLSFDVTGLDARVPKLESLELKSGACLTVRGQLVRPMSSLSFAAKEDLALDCELPATTFSFSLSGRRLTRAPRLGREHSSLSVQLEQPHERDMEELLSGVHHVRAMHFRGMPIDEHTVVRLVKRLEPDYIDIVDTGIGEAAVRKIAALFPAMRMHPWYADESSTEAPTRH